jgi:3-isopropylmalate/(R)-2-methylmalate dehydratase large subunit
MGSTLIEKVLAQSAGRDAVGPGEIVVCDVDLTVLLDIQFIHDRLPDVIAVHDADRLAIVMDHAVPAAGLQDAAAGTRARTFAEKHGIEKFFDVGAHGIVHQVLAEQGLALPGTLVACTDSHTCAAGAYNCAARGLGPAEILQIVCTGTTWHQVPPTIRYELTGTPSTWINGKDIFLHIAGEYGDATNRALEFGGDGLAALPMSDRRTIATQGAEVGADFSIFPADQACLDFIAAVAPDADFRPTVPDPDAEYADVRHVDLGSLEPMVAEPGSVIHNTLPVSALDGVGIQQAFIGSCANGQLADLATAAEVVKGHKVAPGVRLIVTPASQRVYLDAVRLGYVETLVAAGAVVTNSTCGACFGYHMGVVGPGEVCLTASTRNFKGRMGSPEASVYMASPATVAASALRGTVADVREVAADRSHEGAGVAS